MVKTKTQAAKKKLTSLANVRPGLTIHRKIYLFSLLEKRKTQTLATFTRYTQSVPTRVLSIINYDNIYHLPSTISITTIKNSTITNQVGQSKLMLKDKGEKTTTPT